MFLLRRGMCNAEDIFKGDCEPRLAVITTTARDD